MGDWIFIYSVCLLQYSLDENASFSEPPSEDHCQQNADAQPGCEEDLSLEFLLPESITLLEDYVRAGEGPEDTLRASTQFLQSIYSER